MGSIIVAGSWVAKEIEGEEQLWRIDRKEGVGGGDEDERGVQYASVPPRPSSTPDL